ncbi:MAG: (2Fe-2S) ferredoxin domain-containing protein [Erysipelotrichaceae bacterium]|nr:(2Fe-2S) ferredoxin domain-containing protein [Erysipelotrichaceae bacterium]MDD3808786.1 (2Fe-2S) ferredoxin domain-containing protein [Erysipelotrichaceae bacterium]
MKTVEELNQLRTKARNKMEMRLDDGHDYFVVVAMGTAGIAAGARNVLLKLVEKVHELKINALVTQDGQIEVTGQEPLVKIVDSTGNQVIYKKVDVAMAEEIIAKHLQNNQVIEEYLLQEGQ